MVWLLQGLIGLAFLVIFLQAFKVVKLKKSQVEKSYFWNVVVYVLSFEGLIYLVGVEGGRKLMALGLINVVLWFNMIKFSLGLIQKREIELYNRFEHFIGGVALFFGLYLIGIGKLLPISYKFAWFESVVVMLIVNWLSVVHEIVELLIDKAMKRKYLIGPGVYDTNEDLLMTWLGSLGGVLGVMVNSWQY